MPLGDLKSTRVNLHTLLYIKILAPIVLYDFVSKNQFFNMDYLHCFFCKWSDWICASRHHRPIRMGCCGNDIGVDNYVCWWCGFPPRTNEKCRSIISPSEQLQSQVAVQQRCSVAVHTAVLVAAWTLLSRHPSDTKETLKSSFSGQSVEIGLERHFKPLFQYCAKHGELLHATARFVSLVTSCLRLRLGRGLCRGQSPGVD